MLAFNKILCQTEYTLATMKSYSIFEHFNACNRLIEHKERKRCAREKERKQTLDEAQKCESRKFEDKYCYFVKGNVTNAHITLETILFGKFGKQQQHRKCSLVYVSIVTFYFSHIFFGFTFIQFQI